MNLADLKRRKSIKMAIQKALFHICDENLERVRLKKIKNHLAVALIECRDAYESRRRSFMLGSMSHA